MNPHPTHTQCVGRMGATAIDSRHRCRCVVLLFSLFPPHLDEWVFFWVHLCVFCAFFGALVCVWNVFFPLSNIVSYRKIFYICLQFPTLKMPAQPW